MSSSSEFQREQLLAEELTPEEVRLLVERLDARSFGGSEHATVGAVVEATGASASDVGRILGEIRKEDFEERFGIRIEQHEHRIESLENQAKRLEATGSSLKKPSLDRYQQIALDKLAAQERQHETLQPIVYIILFLLVLVFAALVETDGFKPSRQQSGRTIRFETNDGMVEGRPDGSTIVYKRDGTTRTATPDERAIASSLLTDKH